MVTGQPANPYWRRHGVILLDPDGFQSCSYSRPGPRPGSSGVPRDCTGRWEASGELSRDRDSRELRLTDFQAGYLIADRLGMSVELIPHLFGATNRFPTGQRGLFAIWRTGGGVTAANALRYLEVGALRACGRGVADYHGCQRCCSMPFEPRTKVSSRPSVLATSEGVPAASPPRSFHPPQLPPSSARRTTWPSLRVAQSTG